MQCNQTCAPSPLDSLTSGLTGNRTVIFPAITTTTTLGLTLIETLSHDYLIVQVVTLFVTQFHYQLSYLRFILHFDQDMIVGPTTNCVAIDRLYIHSAEVAHCTHTTEPMASSSHSGGPTAFR